MLSRPYVRNSLRLHLLTNRFFLVLSLAVALSSHAKPELRTENDWAILSVKRQQLFCLTRDLYILTATGGHTPVLTFFPLAAEGDNLELLSGDVDQVSLGSYYDYFTTKDVLHTVAKLRQYLSEDPEILVQSAMLTARKKDRLLASAHYVKSETPSL